MRKSIRVFTLIKDDQSGGFTAYAFNSPEERHAHVNENKDEEDHVSQEDIDNGEDEYENGYVGEDTIEVDVDEAGNVTLAAPISFHGGQ